MKPIKIEISIPDEDLKQFIVDVDSQVISKSQMENYKNTSFNKLKNVQNKII